MSFSELSLAEMRGGGRSRYQTDFGNAVTNFPKKSLWILLFTMPNTNLIRGKESAPHPAAFSLGKCARKGRRPFRVLHLKHFGNAVTNFGNAVTNW